MANGSLHGSPGSVASNTVASLICNLVTFDPHTLRDSNTHICNHASTITGNASPSVYMVLMCSSVGHVSCLNVGSGGNGPEGLSRCESSRNPQPTILATCNPVITTTGTHAACRGAFTAQIYKAYASCLLHYAAAWLRWSLLFPLHSKPKSSVLR